MLTYETLEIGTCLNVAISAVGHSALHSCVGVPTAIKNLGAQDMRGSLLHPPPPDRPPQVPPAAALDPIGEGDSPSSLTSPTPGFLPGSSIPEADLDAFARIASADSRVARSTSADSRVSMRDLCAFERSTSMDSRVSMRGAVLAPANASGLSRHSSGTGSLGSGGIDDLRLHPIVRGAFTMRSELMHCFVSYRVTTEGMALTLQQSSAETGALQLSRPLRATAAHRAPLTP